MTLQVTVKDVIEETTYQNTVFEYRVVVEYNGVTFGIFDYDMHSSPDLIGHTCEIVLIPYLVVQIAAAEEDMIGIHPNDDEPRGWKYHTYIGQITSITSEKTPSATLDLGTGTVDINLDAKENEIEVNKELREGDIIQVRTVRTDLGGIININK